MKIRLPKSAAKAVDLLIQDHQRMEFIETHKVDFLKHTAGSNEGKVSAWIPEPFCLLEFGMTRREAVDALMAAFARVQAEKSRMKALDVLLKGRKG